MKNNDLPHQEPIKSRRSVVLFALLAILVVVLAWHILLPLFGIAVVLSLGLLSVIVLSVVLVGIGVLLIYFLPALLIGLVALIALGWVLIALALFPFLFPLLAPLLIILWIAAYLIGKGRRRS